MSMECIELDILVICPCKTLGGISLLSSYGKHRAGYPCNLSYAIHRVGYPYNLPMEYTGLDTLIICLWNT